jgi:hypothetical protein
MPNREDILRLRVLVGYLGERQQPSWWASSFFDPTSEAFLAPIFGDAAANARVVGVTEAARRIHDDAIGVGRTFHLFRLPETLEQALHLAVSRSKQAASIKSVDTALAELGALSSCDSVPKPGPSHVGPLTMLANMQWVPVVASHYQAAFAAGIRTFPYFAG